MKSLSRLFLTVLIFFAFLSCANPAKDLKLTLKKTAADMNVDFVKCRTYSTDLHDKIVKAYETGFDAADISKMDEKNGGDHASFKTDMYYKKKTNDDDITVLATGFAPVTDKIKKEIKTFETLLGDDLRMKVKDNQILYSIGFFSVKSEFTVQYPFVDMVSAIPPKLDILKPKFAANAIPKNNPKGEIIWDKDVIFSMAGGGLIISITSPVYIKDEFTAFTIVAPSMPNLLKKYNIEDSKDYILLLSPSTMVIGASSVCANALKLTILKPFDYVQQLKTNPQAAEDYKLTFEKKTEGLQSIGKNILAGKTVFDAKVEGKNYAVVAEKIDEVNFYLVGLAKK
jgi:hypothetical protein